LRVEIKSVTKDITVTVFKGDTSEGIEKALRIFKKKIQGAGLFKDLKDKRYFEKPGDKRRRKIRENQRRLRKQK
jgi:small subunit ribosomal protein S21